MLPNLIHRRPEEEEGALPSDSYRPKRSKPSGRMASALDYVLREQRPLFVLVGIAIATTLFLLNPHLLHQQPSLMHQSALRQHQSGHEERQLLQKQSFISTKIPSLHSQGFSPGAKIPLGLKRKALRVLVTGGAGFVGSHLVDRLISRGDSVIVVDNFFTGRKENVMHHFSNPQFELIRHDVVEPLLLETVLILNVLEHKTNVVGTLNMLGLAKRVGARFLLTSTSEVYGDPLEHPQRESYWGNVNPIGVRSCYDEGKRTAETLTMDYHRGADVEVRIARIFNTYGPRMCIDDGRVVSNFVAQALRKEPMTVYGDGKQTRSFQFVSDLVEGLIRLMEGEHIGPFNLGNPGEFTMLELAEVVKEVIDPNARIQFRKNTEDDPHKRKPDISKAKNLLGWEPKIPLREGLPMMVEDFRRRVFQDTKEVVKGFLIAYSIKGGGLLPFSSIFTMYNSY
ncbi:hypothetical protein GOP47_0029019 [Adiantum capillus-veneris]|nr:hypothetical protein GOP47_0029019 [Adiantum capillus-veneris]